MLNKKAPKGKYAWTVTVGEKGQIVIPKQAREVFGIAPGDTLILLGDEARGIAIPPKSTFSEFFGVAFEEKEE
ncbi:MAG: AbrB/MazE/SpoVT family DNA-binding domain-containing protein [Lachnospiraceae bacterium]|nr:AbrB/MazE/SpoVT family DNA-binding domain-containing protein [Lachnospiraceae bacterium]